MIKLRKGKKKKKSKDFISVDAEEIKYIPVIPCKWIGAA